MRLTPAIFLTLVYLLAGNAAHASGNCSNEDSCIAEGSWQFGLAAGIGGRTNPLVNGDTIPFILLPDIAWYGETFYFDNGELGYQLFPTDNTSVEWFIVPNAQKANFTFWHSSNVLVPMSSFTNAPRPAKPGKVNIDVAISADDVSRKWAIDAGIRWQWHHQRHHFRATLLGDVSGVYNGSHAAIEYRYQVVAKERWQGSIAPQLTWMSAALTNYYYGVSPSDTLDRGLYYNASSGFQFGFSANATYTLDENWRLLTRASVTRLHKGMRKSPLVEDDQIYAFFAGVAYRF